MTDERIKDYFLPVRILACDNVKNADALLSFDGEKPQASLYPSDKMFSVKGKGFVLLDFGKEYCGGIRLITFIARGQVHIRFGESASEACSELGEKGSGNDHSVRDFTVGLISFSDSDYGCTGYRFVRLDFESEEGEMFLTGIFGSCVYRKLDLSGSFICDDEETNEIWNTAARTLQLNMQNMLWDGIKRDRLVWVGDMYPEMLALTDLYGRNACINEALEFVRKNTRSRWMNGIPAYSAWWILNACDYFLRTGEDDYLKTHTQDIIGILENFSSCVIQGNLCFGNDEMAYYFDWPTHGQGDSEEGVRALLIFAAREAEKALSLIGEDVSEARRLRRLLHKRCISSRFKQITAMQYFSGESPLSAGERLSSGGAKGMSGFQSYFILRAAAETAGAETAYAMMKEYFGGMLRLGATSFWEDFDIEWVKEPVCPIDRLPRAGERDIHGDFGKFCYTGFRHSLCHGWSTGAVPFLTEVVAGVVRKGISEVVVSPHLCGLHYVRARIPLVGGELEVECDAGKTKILRAPDKIQVDIK